MRYPSTEQIVASDCVPAPCCSIVLLAVGSRTMVAGSRPVGSVGQHIDNDEHLRHSKNKTIAGRVCH